MFGMFLILSLSIGATVIIFVNPLLQILSQILLLVFFFVMSRYAKNLHQFRLSSGLFLAFGIFTMAAIVREIAGGLVAAYLSGNQVVVPFVDTISVVAVVLLLTKASGNSMGSIYLKRGNLRLGVTAGVVGFFVLFIGILAGFQLLYGNLHGISFEELLSLLPIILILAFLNAPKEEIWFRGLFLRKSGKLFGKNAANLLQAPLFALAHLNAQYSQFGLTFQIGFLILVFSLGLFWGYLIQRTDSILGSSLIHAGADVAIFLPILLSLL